jgi:cytochrome P460/putative zinc finger protein
MNCAFSKEVLALYVEGDLSDESASTVRRHLSRCSECADFCDGLHNTQSLLKSLRRSVATPDALVEVRHRVFTRIENVRDALGFVVRLERFFLLGMRRRKYAMAAALVFAIVSASVLGEMQQRGLVNGAAVFNHKDMLVQPDYGGWVLVGASVATADAHSGISQNVYIDPAAYRTYGETGKFPEGTVMVLEASNTESGSLSASVKDSRFPGGWGFFTFASDKKAQAAPDVSCRGCHEQRATTDHVFTQFYPALRAISFKS